MTKDRLFFNILTYGMVTIAAFACVFPFVMLISASFSDETEIMRHGYSIFPRGFTTEAYRIIMENPSSILRAYGITIFVTGVGTLASLFFMTMAAYALANRRFRWRNKFSFYFFFTTLFSGGVVPWYILMVSYLKMKNNILAMIIPYMFNVFYLIIIRSFMSSLPEAIEESVRIDGAGEFTILFRLIIPLSLPAIVTIALFVALGYWNDWYLSMMFISKDHLFSLQYSLYRMLSSMEGLKMAIAKGANINVSTIPTETVKNAMALVATGPILLLYPFVQKFFVKGLTIGAVKG